MKKWSQRNMIFQEHWNFKAQIFGAFNVTKGESVLFRKWIRKF